MTPLLDRLRERKLIQWALAYLGGAWLLLQVLDVLGQNFDWPPVLFRSATVVLGVGFLVTLVLAWYHGEQGRQRISGPELLMLSVLFVLTGVGLAWVGQDTLIADPNGLQANALHPWVSDAVETRSVAVLPFNNLSSEAENEYFSDGIAEDILSQLSKISSLRVISRTSVAQYKGTTKPLRQIGQELGVAHVLGGSVRRAGDRVRISVQMFDARTDQQLWAQTYDRELRDVFQIQSEIAERIVAALHMELSGAERVRIAAVPTSSVAAYDYYLLGRHHWNRRTTAGFQSALEYFQRAIEIDSGFTLAYVGLADTYILHALWWIQPHFEAVPKAKQAALRALQLDSTSAEVHTSLAEVHVLEWDWLTAEKSFRRALSLNPNYAIARHWYGQFLMYMARYDEAIRMAESARNIDPLSPIINADLGQVYLEARRYAEAEAQFTRTLELDPQMRIALSGLAQTYERTGRDVEALRFYERLREGGGSVFLLAAFYARQGRREESRRLLDTTLEDLRSRGLYIRPAQVARVLVALGEFDEAFAWLEKGYVERDSFMVLLRDSSDFDAIRSDPRFSDLQRRMNFPMSGLAAQ